MRATLVFLGLTLVVSAAPRADAQSLGTFAWQIEPYCNVVRFTVTPDGPVFRLTGEDDHCGAGRTPAAGVVTPNPDGTFTLAFYLITPQGLASHTTATLAPGSYAGPWKDDGGLTGTLRFGPPPAPAGSPRPAAEFQQRVTGTCAAGEFVKQVHTDGSVTCGAATGSGGGDITAVSAGTGLTGGGTSGDVTLGIASGGVGSLQIADGSITAADVNTAQLQRRVANVCAPGLYFVGIDAGGVANCQDGGWGDNTALGLSALSTNAGTTNTGLGSAALTANTTGTRNTAVGAETLMSNVTGQWNSALGASALRGNVNGNANIAVGESALRSNVNGSNNTAVGFDAMYENTSGGQNTAIGSNALVFNTTGWYNTGAGYMALQLNTTGDRNTGIGDIALRNNTTASGNTALGQAALYSNSTGPDNVAVGARALFSSTGGFNAALGYQAGSALTTGFENTALGYNALPDATTGSRNIAIGSLAGHFITTGSDNIHIGYQGSVNESDTIRIGVAQTRAFIRGIRGVTTGVANAVAVVVDSNGQLGTISSSRRTKEDIRDMGDASAGLFRLRPVTFRYIQPYADGSTPRDYGLIAEEVEEVYPDLVVRNEAGEVETVQYHKLVPMLLNEVQRQRLEMAAQRRALDGQAATIAALQRRLDALESHPR